jgi:hypothetical protein
MMFIYIVDNRKKLYFVIIIIVILLFIRPIIGFILMYMLEVSILTL